MMRETRLSYKHVGCVIDLLRQRTPLNDIVDVDGRVRHEDARPFFENDTTRTIKAKRVVLSRAEKNVDLQSLLLRRAEEEVECHDKVLARCICKSSFCPRLT